MIQTVTAARGATIDQVTNVGQGRRVIRIPDTGATDIEVQWDWVCNDASANRSGTQRVIIGLSSAPMQPNNGLFVRAN